MGRPSTGSAASAPAAAAALSGKASRLEELMWQQGADAAWRALEEMHRRGETTDRRTISRILKKTVNCRSGSGCRARPNFALIIRGLGLIEGFLDRRPQDVDEVLFNEILDACCVIGDMERFDAARRRMQSLGVAPSPVTLGILVKAYGKQKRIDRVLQVWDEMREQRTEANVVTYSCMVEACVKCRRLAKAIEIFDEMRSQGLHRNTIVYCTLIKGYGLAKDLAGAEELFHEMAIEGVQRNTVTCNAMLDVYVNCGELHKAEALIREMTSDKTLPQPDLISFSTLLKGHCNGGSIEKVFEVVEVMRGRGLAFDELVYNLLIDACTRADDISAGLGLFEEMLINLVPPSACTRKALGALVERAEDRRTALDAVEDLCRQHRVEPPKVSVPGRADAQRRSPARPAQPGPVQPPAQGRSPAPQCQRPASGPALGFVGFGGGVPATAPAAAAAPLPLAGAPVPQGGFGPGCGGFGIATAATAGAAPLPPAGAPVQLGGFLLAVSVPANAQLLDRQAICGAWLVPGGSLGFAQPPPPALAVKAAEAAAAAAAAAAPFAGHPQVAPTASPALTLQQLLAPCGAAAADLRCPNPWPAAPHDASARGVAC